MSRFLDSWLSWVMLIVVLRLAIWLAMSPSPSPQQVAITHLAQVALNAPHEPMKIQALESLYQMATSEEVRVQIVGVLHQYAKASTDIQNALWKLEHDPEIVLQQTVNTLFVPWENYTKELVLWLTAVCGLVFTGGMPLVIFWLASYQGLNKIFGRYGWQKIVLVNTLAWVACPIFLWYVGIPAVVQALWALAAGGIFAYLVRSGTLAALFGINQFYMRRALWTMCGLLVIGLLPHILWQSRSTVTTVTPAQLMEAIDEAAKARRVRVSPYLVTLLRYPNLYASAKMAAEIHRHSLVALGKLGDETTLETIFPFLYHADVGLQQAALEAITKISRHAWNKELRDKELRDVAAEGN